MNPIIVGFDAADRTLTLQFDKLPKGVVVGAEFAGDAEEHAENLKFLLEEERKRAKRAERDLIMTQRTLRKMIKNEDS